VIFLIGVVWNTFLIFPNSFKASCTEKPFLEKESPDPSNTCTSTKPKMPLLILSFLMSLIGCGPGVVNEPPEAGDDEALMWKGNAAGNEEDGGLVWKGNAAGNEEDGGVN